MIQCTASALRGELIKAMLEAFELPEYMVPAFDAVVNNLKHTICTLRADGRTMPAQFWLMFTTTVYNLKLKRVE